MARTSGPAATIPRIKRWLLVLLAAAIAGCGELTLDSSKAERLARKVAGLGNLKLTSVSCPDGVTAKKGADFTCKLVFAHGSKGTITIHQTNGDGAIRAAVSDIRRSAK